ncbi:MAG: FAD-binding oxidoreductase [Gammaproteobacteria bacterium]|nr:FAD-binding oxidoreductase [Gammaproteobacteria bacterium]MCW8927376.1 FAD-binding oxidoreductase [Gammaproteobacteria bacterium]MCW8973671.1 FAD-binding oxidoreductase [Gammaproteobacteria bacterium]MCW8992468.1 FAD-binding oxidoreductase [Gammaproteobacteria bacterium]
MEHRTTILMSQFITHDVKRFIVERPAGFRFEPGQGVELAIDKDDWREEPRPFTPTSLPDDAALEFIIKGYPEHQGVTRELHRMEAGEALLMSEPFGSISYRGPGTFIAGGAGITPFLSILRMLHRRGELEGNSLIFSNKGPRDIIAEKELQYLLGEQAHFLCSQQEDCRCRPGRLNRSVLQNSIKDFSQHFYLCGPPPFVSAINDALAELGAVPDAVVFER